MESRKIINGYFCKKCRNHHYSYGKIGIEHKKYKLKVRD